MSCQWKHSECPAVRKLKEITKILGLPDGETNCTQADAPEEPDPVVERLRRKQRAAHAARSARQKGGAA